MEKKILLIALILWALPLSHDWNKLILWNVGQGQWVTLSTSTDCLHIDAGGEYFPSSKKLLAHCSGKNNEFHITHTDRDHISFLSRAQFLLKTTCVHPLHIEIPWSKKKFFWKVNWCHPLKGGGVKIKEIYSGVIDNPKNTNSTSRVFVMDNQFLVSGDSMKKQEKIWVSKIQKIPITVFILGHHGSLTSNSYELLGSLRHLKLALVSARKKRYGHPHYNVLQRLYSLKIPVLTTESFNNIFIEY